MNKQVIFEANEEEVLQFQCKVKMERLTGKLIFNALLKSFITNPQETLEFLKIR